MVTKVCPICQVPFEARGRRKYCSPECSKIAKREQDKVARKKLLEKDPNYFRDYQREHPEYVERFHEKNPDYRKEYQKQLLEKDPDYYARKMREYEPVASNNAQLGSQQYVARADWSEKPTDGGLTKEQQRQLDDIKRLKRQCGLE